MRPLVSRILGPLRQNGSGVLGDLWPRKFKIYHQNHWLVCLSTIFLKISVDDDTRYHFFRYSPSIKESKLFYTKSFQLSNGKYLFTLGDPPLGVGEIGWERERQRERERLWPFVYGQFILRMSPLKKPHENHARGFSNYKKFAHRWALVSSGNVSMPAVY